LRKVVTERIAQNHHQYAKFSDRLKELLDKLDGAQLSWADKLKMAEELAKDLETEAEAHEGTGLSAGSYGILQVLRAFGADAGAEDLAIRIEVLYSDDATAPPRWQEKEGLRRTLRQQVRGMAHEFGLKDLKAVPEHVEEFALKHFAKV
jgi:type I restriction enzyme R subunit